MDRYKNKKAKLRKGIGVEKVSRGLNWSSKSIKISENGIALIESTKTSGNKRTAKSEEDL
jgi:hypothetical protein